MQLKIDFCLFEVSKNVIHIIRYVSVYFHTEFRSSVVVIAIVRNKTRNSIMGLGPRVCRTGGEITHRSHGRTRSALVSAETLLLPPFRSDISSKYDERQNVHCSFSKRVVRSDNILCNQFRRLHDVSGCFAFPFGVTETEKKKLEQVFLRVRLLSSGPTAFNRFQALEIPSTPLALEHAAGLVVSFSTTTLDSMTAVTVLYMYVRIEAHCHRRVRRFSIRGRFFFFPE